MQTPNMRYSSLVRRLALLGVLLVMASSSVAAQGTGQICLSAFEDVNGNQIKDLGEAPITQDIIVTLADAENVIVQSLRLNDSSLASNGVVCFQSLAAGQYTLTAASATYDPTTTTSFLTVVTDNGVPQRFDYGGKLAISRAAAPVGMTAQERQTLTFNRVLFSSIGALVAVAFVGFIGILVYWLGFRLPPRSQVDWKQKYGTGQYPAVGYAVPAQGQYTPAPNMRPVDPATGQLRGVPAVPPAAIPPTSFDDTGPVRTVAPADVPADVPPPIATDLNLPPASDDDTGRYRPPRE